MATSTSLPAILANSSRSIAQSRLSRLNWRRLSYRVALQVMAIVLPVTLLASATHAAAYLARGDRGYPVTELQERLNQLGYSLSVDGEYGSATEQAVRDFQRSRRLNVDGVVGEDTSIALGLSLAPNAGDEVSYGPITSGNCQSTRINQSSPSSLPNKQYRVIIPTTQDQIFQRIRFYCPSARAVATPLGSYIAVGSFVSRGSAEAHSQSFHRRGIRDAHVRYF